MKYLFYIVILTIITLNSYYSCAIKSNIPEPKEPLIVVEIRPSPISHRFTNAYYVVVDSKGKYFEIFHLYGEYEVGDTIIF